MFWKCSLQPLCWEHRRRGKYRCREAIQEGPVGLGETIVLGPGWRQREPENGVDLRGLQVGEPMDWMAASQGERRTMTEREGAWLTSRFLPGYLQGQGDGCPGLRSELPCPPGQAGARPGSGGPFLLVLISLHPHSLASPSCSEVQFPGLWLDVCF